MGVWGKKNFFQEVFFPHEKTKTPKKTKKHQRKDSKR
jgi:hypothetical protein